MWVFQSLEHQELQKRERLQQQWLQALVSCEYLSRRPHHLRPRHNDHRPHRAHHPHRPRSNR